jgi:hypothetical protein
MTDQPDHARVQAIRERMAWQENTQQDLAYLLERVEALRVQVEERYGAVAQWQNEAETNRQAWLKERERVEALGRERDALDLRWAAASEFVRDVIEALGRTQPSSEFIVDLPELAMQVVGQIEEYKVRAEAAEAARDAALAVVQNFANPENWSDKVGCLQWIGKRHGLEYANSMLAALAPAGEQERRALGR